MPSVRQQLRDEIVTTIDDLNTRIANNDALNVTYGTWNVPGITRDNLIQIFKDAIDRIDRQGDDAAVENEDAILEKSVQAINYLRVNTGPQLGGNQAWVISVYALTAYGVQDTLSTLWPHVNQAEAARIGEILRNSKRRVRFLETSLDSLTPRTQSLGSMVSRIEAAHAAAESLPAEMEDLREAKDELSRLKRESGKDYEEVQRLTVQYNAHLENAKNLASQTVEKLNEQLEKGSGLVAQLDQLHRIGTSTVLAGAFNERAKKLNHSVYIWLGVLLVALGSAALFGHERTGILTDLMRTSSTATETLVIQTILMILGMGAPIWLGWVATKQIAQRFKLAEDYHYKASISNAYEGYRREAVDLDDDFRRQLFQSALGRLDELPLRVMDQENHGSPAHDLMSRPGFWSFMIQVFGKNKPVTVEAPVAVKQNAASTANAAAE